MGKQKKRVAWEKRQNNIGVRVKGRGEISVGRIIILECGEKKKKDWSGGERKNNVGVGREERYILGWGGKNNNIGVRRKEENRLG